MANPKLNVIKNAVADELNRSWGMTVAEGSALRSELIVTLSTALGLTISQHGLGDAKAVSATLEGALAFITEETSRLTPFAISTAAGNLASVRRAEENSKRKEKPGG